MTELRWLPTIPDWRARLRRLAATEDLEAAWHEAVALANIRLDFVATNALDTVVQRLFTKHPPAAIETSPVRLAILGSSTHSHLVPAIRIAGLRKSIWIDTYEAAYGQYLQELTDHNSGLHDFHPDIVLFNFDAHHLAGSVHAALTWPEADAALEEVSDRLRSVWRLSREKFGCAVIQQTGLPVHPLLLGANEHRLPGSKAGFLRRFNCVLRPLADSNGVHLLALDDWVARNGISAWHDPDLWFRAKQEISPIAAPLYGELLGRIVAAVRGRSFKCLVLDLDDTIWGGTIGDDGLEGIVLGQGSALGEAFIALQQYAREQARRGVILAVCSKNDPENAVVPFTKHPEMILTAADIACFVANWEDKPANIRRIAKQLSIGLDAMVFVDDNPFERALVRRELPMVGVPELPPDPTLVVPCLADAGYFEAVTVTEEDLSRTVQYKSNADRAALRDAATDLPAYLRSLEMELRFRSFDKAGLPRIVQLANKTNQFNLTTRRYTEEEVLAAMADPRVLCLQFRLVDRFGDNGMIGIVIAEPAPESAAEMIISSWLMSCRVLGRGVERAMLEVVVARARLLGAERLVGIYKPTSKNGMVRDHYEKLGFTAVDGYEQADMAWALDLRKVTPPGEMLIKMGEG